MEFLLCQVLSESRKGFAPVKGEILNERPMATETNQLHKYIIFKWVLHNYSPFLPAFRLHERMAENQTEYEKTSLQTREGSFPLPLSNKACMFPINHTLPHSPKQMKKPRGRARSDPHNPAPTTPAAMLKNHKDLTCTALACGSCPWCDTIILKDPVLEIPLPTGKCILLSLVQNSSW